MMDSLKHVGITDFQVTIVITQQKRIVQHFQVLCVLKCVISSSASSPWKPHNLRFLILCSSFIFNIQAWVVPAVQSLTQLNKPILHNVAFKGSLSYWWFLVFTLIVSVTTDIKNPQSGWGLAVTQKRWKGRTEDPFLRRGWDGRSAGKKGDGCLVGEVRRGVWEKDEISWERRSCCQYIWRVRRKSLSLLFIVYLLFCQSASGCRRLAFHLLSSILLPPSLSILSWSGLVSLTAACAHTC